MSTYTANYPIESDVHLNIVSTSLLSDLTDDEFEHIIMHDTSLIVPIKNDNIEVAKVVDFCIVEFMGISYEVDYIKYKGVDEETGLGNAEINGIDMVFNDVDLIELMEDFCK